MSTKEKLVEALNEGLTVREMMELLSQYNPEQKVCFAYNYGDHWRTTVAPAVTSVNEADVIWSDYHDMPKVFDDSEEEEEPESEEDSETVNVIVFNLG